MQFSTNIHSFHIPVMGLSYTIDTPIRVAHLGISSVIAITDDELIEKMRALYCKKINIPYVEISKKTFDFRAERIKQYLNLVNQIVNQKFQDFKSELIENKQSLESYLDILPDGSEFKSGLRKLYSEGNHLKHQIGNYLNQYLNPGAIDVNIMTKVDRENYDKNEKLPVAFNDAHAALRGFAASDLNSSVVLSAGMNPRLFSYFEEFPAFYPDQNGHLKKKIILKVSDFRSAMIQGNMLAKKGLWVSEYRIESGLNCGGHAFATDGLLLGPILEELKEKKSELVTSNYQLLVKALQSKGLPVPAELPLKITAQGGVGTAEEHNFLLEQFNLESIGWGSPFLLVPEATSVDDETRLLLQKGEEKDFYLSNISPLGVPFNTIKNTTNDYWKNKRIAENKAGSSCPKKYLALDKQFDDEGLCTASKKYQDIKLNDLETNKLNLSVKAYHQKRNEILEKACLCVGLANASYLENDIKVKGQQQGVVICPGPNLAYFDKIVSLREIVQHIYGNSNVLAKVYRPNMFIKELTMYMDHFKKGIESLEEISAAQEKKWKTFQSNLLNGIQYYKDTFQQSTFFTEQRKEILNQLENHQLEIEKIMQNLADKIQHNNKLLSL